jgi:hypothetical protein
VAGIELPAALFLKFIIMEVTLSSSSVERVAQRVVEILLQRQTPDLCTTSEAAKILGITPAYLRRIADRYPHIKQGEGKQARLLFRKEGLL